MESPDGQATYGSPASSRALPFTYAPMEAGAGKSAMVNTNVGALFGYTQGTAAA